MKLGILVNSDRNLNHVVGVAAAALGKGHEVAVFAMDEGVRLLLEPVFRELCVVGGAAMSFCDQSTRVLCVAKDSVPPDIICGSQYDNAVMMHTADRVIVL